ncbi:Short-chain dehydrogenase/reductase SDR [Sphingopyxis sp. LC81]|uniref:SDR family NAD(P)-dependent oxidoreductase n=1 Tax=Sphingopyxis sp. LC81 TaxID=1502850 RepID=UPI0005104E99|nr:SDR family NAD(P)-dependent oxidoreductase [Sphingopyxis sp. LC81]KGB56729.1 Short-chain dehydrogenase/reductase SDR [Sphingopyxis sp. LC81]
MINPAIAVVTGASRGAGKGIAIGLGEKGMTVYVTGRSSDRSDATGWDGSPLAGTIHETAAAVTAAGGKGIAVACDHADDAQVAALFERVRKDSGRLDILVNNATYIHHQLITQAPFWEKELAAVEILNVGLRSAYVASWHAAGMMVGQKSGLIAFTSSFGASCYMHGAAYGAQKAGVDKFAHDMAVDFRPHGVRTVSIWLGPQITERALGAAEVHKEQYEGFMAMAEMPQFTGHIIHAIATDPKGDELSGHTVIGAEIAGRYGITDRGKTPPSHREMLGSPRDPNPAIVY